MNEKSLPPTQAIKDWLAKALQLLNEVDIPSARLDSEIILASALQKDHSYLYAYPDQLISQNSLKTADKNLDQRIKRVPIAYILGYKEFYGRKFNVNSSTLIPRPESEQIIETLKVILKNKETKGMNLIDVGTGTGCLGITAKLEFSSLSVTLIDISSGALDIAKNNAKELDANVNVIENNLLQDYPEKLDIIVANLPYVDKRWDRSPETDYEPSLALFADSNGEQLIKELVEQASGLLKLNGYLIIEADPVQHDSLINHAKKFELDLLSKNDYVFCLTNNASADTTKANQ